jgi:DNA-binding GntR family transcriptional regulator
MAGFEQKKAYDAIKQAIVTGEFDNGMHLRSATLAERLGVSRTPVREALHRLHAEGLVDIFENRGAFVANYAREDAAEVFDLRAELESRAAALASQKMTAPQIDELSRFTDRMEKHAGGRWRDIALVTEANKNFHSLIIAAAASRRLSAVISSIVEIALVSRTFHSYSSESFARSIAHHREMIAAFKVRDEVWAASIMTSHIRAAYHVFLTAELGG